jgi:hypothetical protein
VAAIGGSGEYPLQAFTEAYMNEIMAETWRAGADEPSHLDVVRNQVADVRQVWAADRTHTTNVCTGDGTKRRSSFTAW